MVQEQSPTKISRRRALQAAGAAGAAVALGVAGIKPAAALTEFRLASPMYGRITGGWHSGALDMAHRAGAISVWAYFRRGSVAYGYIEIRPILWSCETSTPGNGDHRKFDFYLRKDGDQAYVGTARAQHVQNVGVVESYLYLCPKWLAEEGQGGAYAGANCYTGIHIHYWANGTQVGTYSYNDNVYLDSPVMWKWNV